jgi:hypothetical protein
LLFVGVLLAIALAWRKLAGERGRPIAAISVGRLAPYAMGCYAAFLVWERAIATFA